jgi:hypothetical protein
MDAPDTILDEITGKHLILYGQVERMDPTRLQKIMINWKPQGTKKKKRPSRRTWKDGIYTAMRERGLRMGEWNNRRQWNWKSEGVARRLKPACTHKERNTNGLRLIAKERDADTHLVLPQWSTFCLYDLVFPRTSGR